MTEKNYDPRYPVIVALAGLAGTGKTSTASTIVPYAIAGDDADIKWDHYYLAMPIYEIVSIIRTTEGEDRKDRIRYGIHEALLDTFGRSPLYGAPRYDDLVNLVKEFSNAQVGQGKPRSFMQMVGETCRKYDPDCFVKRLKRVVYQAANSEISEDDNKAFIAFVSDMRYYNEAEFFKNLPNGILIRLDASEDVRRTRLEARDGVSLTPEQMAHESETSLVTIPEEWFDYILDTDNLTVEEQADQVKAIVFNTLKGLRDAETVGISG